MERAHRQLKLIDVSFRDGGHISQFHMETELIKALIDCPEQSGIDYIEIGYRNGAIRPMDNIGLIGLCPDPYLAACQERIHRAKIAVMAHPQNLKSCDLYALKDNGVSLLRLCIAVGAYKKAMPWIEKARAVGLEVSANFIHASQYPPQTLVCEIQDCVRAEPSMIYLADSNGCMHPFRVRELFASLNQAVSVPLGFHAHDNIGLAQANAIAAIEGGAQFIDASLAGIGKGIGNLRLEFFVAYLQSLGVTRYDLRQLTKTSNYVRSHYQKVMSLPFGEFLRGIEDLSTLQLAQKEQEVSDAKS